MARDMAGAVRQPGHVLGRLFLQYDETLSHDVVKALLPLREGYHEVPDVQDQARDHLAEVPAGGPGERDSPSAAVCDHNAQGHLPQRGLVRRTLHDGVVEPRQDERQG